MASHPRQLRRSQWTLPNVHYYVPLTASFLLWLRLNVICESGALIEAFLKWWGEFHSSQRLMQSLSFTLSHAFFLILFHSHSFFQSLSLTLSFTLSLSLFLSLSRSVFHFLSLTHSIFYFLFSLLDLLSPSLTPICPLLSSFLSFSLTLSSSHFVSEPLCLTQSHSRSFLLSVVLSISSYICSVSLNWKTQ